MSSTGFLGIDIGTQGLSVVLTDDSLRVLATGEASYSFIDGLDAGCYEQRTEDWETALSVAMDEARKNLKGEQEWKPSSIGISGQMHGEVLADERGNALGHVRLWCDGRNDDTAKELEAKWQKKIPRRMTVARWLWTCRNRKDLAHKTKHLTTPAGWCGFRLSGSWTLGVGDASGMFPLDEKSNCTQKFSFDSASIKRFDEDLVNNPSVAPVATLLPTPLPAGSVAGHLTESGAELLGLPRECIGVPIAPPEGDQVAALAGSLIGRPGTISCCFGTSVCANVVGTKALDGVHAAVDYFCAADGKPIHMIWLANGTTFLNAMVDCFGGTSSFAEAMVEALKAPADCGGLMALPFLDEEPGLGVVRGSSCVLGWSSSNAIIGNVAKAALLSSIFNLRLGLRILDEQQQGERAEIVLTGGLSKTPGTGQILADVLHTPVVLWETADEGSSWGAAVLARFCFERIHDSNKTWPEFLYQLRPKPKHRFLPNKDESKAYDLVFDKYQKALRLHSSLSTILN